MKKLLMAFMLLGLLAGCTSDPGASETAAPGNYETITAQEAKQMMDDASAYVLVDVRTQSEYEQERIEGAILIPDTEIAARAEQEIADKSALIFVYCRSGVRSNRAAQILAGLGYSKVYDMGGILYWPYETVSG